MRFVSILKNITSSEIKGKSLWKDLKKTGKLRSHYEKGGLSKHMTQKDEATMVFPALKSNKKTESKKFPTGPIERTPKPGYLIALVPFLGVRW